MTIEQLALRLGLRIEQRDETFIVMKNAANTVLVFTHTDGRFFVNGKPVGSVGNVEEAGGAIHVPATLADQIRPHLRAAPAGAARRHSRSPRTRGVVIVDAGHGGHDPGTISRHRHPGEGHQSAGGREGRQTARSNAASASS